MKTTKADFELFKKYCDEAIQKLGLVEWSVHYSHDKAEGCYARTYWKLSDAVATIVFAKEWDDLWSKNEKNIRQLAFHEVLHVVMAPLVAEAGERYTNQLALDTAEHLIIRRLENVIVPSQIESIKTNKHVK